MISCVMIVINLNGNNIMIALTMAYNKLYMVRLTFLDAAHIYGSRFN